MATEGTHATSVLRTIGYEGDSVIAPRASCRTQLSDHAGEKPPHPIEKVVETLS